MPIYRRALFLLVLALQLSAAAFADGVVKTDVIYDQIGGETLKLDLYLPANYSGASMPTIVYTHGGCFNCGDKKNISANLKRMVDDGFVVASVGYRLANNHPYPAGFTDAQQAVRFLRMHAQEYGINPEMIASYGESSGGTFASLLGVHRMPDRQGHFDQYSNPVAAVVDWYGRTDLARLQPSGGGDCASVWLGKPKTPENLPEFRAASVLPFVTPESPPFFIVHGTVDPQVEPAHSAMLSQKLRAAGVPYELYFSEGDKHGLTTPESWPLTRDFFLRTMKPAAPVAEKPAIFKLESGLIPEHVEVPNGAYKVRLKFDDCGRLTDGQAPGLDDQEYGIIVRSGVIDLSYFPKTVGIKTFVTGVEILPAGI